MNQGSGKGSARNRREVGPMKSKGLLVFAGVLLLLVAVFYFSQNRQIQRTHVPAGPGPVALFPFDGTTDNATDMPLNGTGDGEFAFMEGIAGRALSLGSENASTYLAFDVEPLPLQSSRDFSVQFWMRTEAEAGRQFALLSQKAFTDNSLASQKQPGWAFFTSGGTWAWTMGSGPQL